MNLNRAPSPESQEISFERIDGYAGFFLFKKFVQDLAQTHSNRDYVDPDALSDPSYPPNQIVTFAARNVEGVIGVVTGWKEGDVFHADFGFSLPGNAGDKLAPKVIERVLQDFSEIHIIPIPLRGLGVHDDDDATMEMLRKREAALRKFYEEIGFVDIPGNRDRAMVYRKKI